MEKHVRLIVGALILLFVMTMMNMCSSCSTSRKLDAVLDTQRSSQTKIDSSFKVHDQQLDVRLQLLAPQIVNQFLNMFNSEKYGNEIQLNQAKIDALNMQLKNEKLKNDAEKKHR